MSNNLDTREKKKPSAYSTHRSGQSSVAVMGRRIQQAFGLALLIAAVIAGLHYVRKGRARSRGEQDGARETDKPPFLFSENVDALAAADNVPKTDMALDLGKGVKMEFLWLDGLGAWAGKYEVTNKEYRRFAPEHAVGELEGHSMDADRQPAVMVTHHQATAFAKWINQACRSQIPDMYRVRLPNERESTAIMQCGDAREYPWGPDWPPPGDWNYHGQEGVGRGSKLETHRDKWPVACPVEQSGRNDWGLYGVGDNVTEWTEKLLDIGAADTGTYLLRGASWHTGDKEQMRSTHSGRLYSKQAREYLGFRLVIGP